MSLLLITRTTPDGPLLIGAAPSAAAARELIIHYIVKELSRSDERYFDHMNRASIADEARKATEIFWATRNEYTFERVG